MAKKTYIVTHPALCLSVNKTMQKLALGEEISLEEKVAASLVKKGRVELKVQKKVKEVDSE